MDVLFDLVPLLISVLALIISVYTWNKGHRTNLDDFCDSALNELVKISLDYPQYRDEELAKAALYSDDELEKLRYDAYATLVWNYLETLYEKYGKRLKKTSFYGAMMSLGKRHRHFLFKDQNYKYYNSDLIKYLQISEQ